MGCCNSSRGGRRRGRSGRIKRKSLQKNLLLKKQAILPKKKDNSEEADTDNK